MINVHRWDETGVGRVESADLPEKPGREGEWVWVDMVDEDPETIRQVGARFGLDPAAVEESFAATNLPQVEEFRDHIFVVLHGFTSGSGELATPEIDVFIGARFLITIRDGDLAMIDQVEKRLSEEGDLPVASPAALLALTAISAGRRFGPLIQELERRVDGLEELAFQGDPQIAVEAHALRRDIIFLRRALAPQFEVYEDLSQTLHPIADDEARRMFVRVANQHRRSLGALEAGRALLGSVLETYRVAVADQTNEIMRVLTVFSAILLPLTLIAGLWGMNFVEIPGDDLVWGFWGLVGAMALLVVSVWVYFSRRGFIGAPRLRDVPKAVGLGLFNVGAAPVRVVAGGIRSLGKGDDGS